MPSFIPLVPQPTLGGLRMGWEGAVGTAHGQVQQLRRPDSNCYANGDLQGGSC